MKGYSLCVNTSTVHLFSCDRVKNLIIEYETQLFCLSEPLRSVIIVNKCFFLPFVADGSYFERNVFAHRVKRNIDFNSLLFLIKALQMKGCLFDASVQSFALKQSWLTMSGIYCFTGG